MTEEQAPAVEEQDPVVVELYKWLQAAVELRFGAGGDPLGPLTIPAYEEGPQAFVAVLIRARQRSDRVEELMGRAGRVRHKLDAKRKDLDWDAQLKMDESLVKNAAKKVEFSTGLERKAEATLEAFAQKRAAFLAQKRLDVAIDVHSGISEIHWGLHGFRTDVREILGTFRMESSLER